MRFLGNASEKQKKICYRGIRLNHRHFGSVDFAFLYSWTHRDIRKIALEHMENIWKLLIAHDDQNT